MQLLIALYIILLDQLLKWRLFDSALFNTGIGWGIFGGNPVYTTAFVGIVSAVVLVAITRSWQKLITVQRLGAAIIGSGVISNFIDRVRIGSVIDPLSVGDWFPHFNLADCAIVVGLVILILFSAKTHVLDPRSPLRQ